MISLRDERTYQFRGLSTDPKPINQYVGNGSLFIEMDTSTIYTYDANNKEWLVLNWNDSPSSEDFEKFKQEVEAELEKIEDYSDVKDIVGTYADLQAYPTDTLNDNDVIEVLLDETQEEANTMYKWHKDSQEFTLIGKLGPYYTKQQSDAKYLKEVKLKIEDSEENSSNSTVQGSLVYVTEHTDEYGHKSDVETPIVSLDTLRDLMNTPSPDTPDVTDEGVDYTNEDLTLIVSDTDGNAVKMSLETLRQRFAASDDADNTSFDDAQNGQFIYEEIDESEIPADWINTNGRQAWEEQYNNPNSTLRKYYTWSDDANKPYKEDLWNYVENRAANLSDARKVDGEYALDENGNYIYDNCERCWLGAINAPGASYPWAVVELPIPFEGTIRFNYKDEEPVYPWGQADRTFTRGFAIASIPSELNKPELKINAEGEAQEELLEGDLVITLLPKIEEEDDN